MIIVEKKIHFQSGQRGRKEMREGEGAPAVPSGRVPRVSRLMALAIRLDQLIRDGQVTDQAELARLGYVSRARLTQIMNLVYLAPDIQEAILFLPTLPQGHVSVTERELRPIATLRDWKSQRRMWSRTLPTAISRSPL